MPLNKEDWNTLSVYFGHLANGMVEDLVCVTWEQIAVEGAPEHQIETKIETQQKYTNKSATKKYSLFSHF